MAVSFGPRRAVIPPSNLGVNLVAQRRVAEAAGRAAERSRIAVSVDAFSCRLWMRQPRGSVPCPCSSRSLGSRHTPLSPGAGDADIYLKGGEGDDLRAVDSGYPSLPPLDGPARFPGEQLPLSPPDGFSSWVDPIARLLAGGGRRCGLCWGTGWIDGHHLWGGQRYLLCATSNPWVTVDPSSDIDVDLESPTPTMVGPGSVTWSLDIQPSMKILDAVRVRCGLLPAEGNWTVTAKTTNYPNGAPLSEALDTVFGLKDGQQLTSGQIPTSITLTLPDGVRVSHLEIVLRSEPLVNLQLPQLQLTASTELVQPMMQDEFELDPIVGWVERGSVLDIPGLGGRIGSLWVISDVNEARIASGATWNVTGTCRNIQPGEVLACASMEDALGIGVIDPGLSTRGLEATGAGVASGLGASTDESLAASNRGSSQREGGGAAPSQRVAIVLNPSPEE